MRKVLFIGQMPPVVNGQSLVTEMVYKLLHDNGANLTFSADLSNAVWNVAQNRATRTATGVLDPYGGTGAATYKRVASDGDLIYRIHSGTIGRPYT
jgi:hypothetical protein